MMTLLLDISVHILIIQYMKSLGNGMRYTMRGANAVCLLMLRGDLMNLEDSHISCHSDPCIFQLV